MATRRAFRRTAIRLRCFEPDARAIASPAIAGRVR